MINRKEIHDAWNEVVQAWKPVWQGDNSLELWVAFMLHCDRLNALARQQGLAALGSALEPLLSLVERLDEPDVAHRAEVDRLLPGVLAAVRTACGPAPRHDATSMSAEEEGMPLIVVLSDAPDLLEELLMQMEHFGYALKVFSDFRAGLLFAQTRRATALIVELGAQIGEAATSAVQQAREFGIPWFAMSGYGNFALRLQAVRLDAQGFFLQPLTATAIADAIDPLGFAVRDEPYRVMIVDDSVTVLASVQRALSAFPNLNFRAVRQPELVLETLLDFTPDVLLLDFHMDGCTGLEVAKIIRQNKAFESIPLIYLTSETSEAIQLEAMRHGGDDYLTKPISQAQLVNTVISKAQRYRSLRKLMAEDSLTGLYNHVKTKALLQHALLQGERQGHAVSYAILDIDYFKRVNDTYGHTIGDRVLRSLARYLRQHVRKADIVGRYGGEEFAIVFVDATVEQAKERLELIREGFARIYHTYDEGIFAVTFSAGLAQYPTYPSMMDLMVAADHALYAAKRAGRNQISCA
ncbi:MAG: diguanylate cyclase [Candidatus Dactylopiibacterium sp.]|nr:diguanylate cyclase [Candidatus Dactylopiibacterium sp.]